MWLFFFLVAPNQTKLINHTNCEKSTVHIHNSEWWHWTQHESSAHSSSLTCIWHHIAYVYLISFGHLGKEANFSKHSLFMVSRVQKLPNIEVQTSSKGLCANHVYLAKAVYTICSKEWKHSQFVGRICAKKKKKKYNQLKLVYTTTVRYWAITKLIWAAYKKEGKLTV